MRCGIKNKNAYVHNIQNIIYYNITNKERWIYVVMKKPKIRGIDFRTTQGKYKSSYSQKLHMRGQISGNVDDLGNCFYRQCNGAVITTGNANRLYDGMKLFKRDSDLVKREYPPDNPKYHECVLYNN